MFIINSYVGADVTIKHPSNSSGASCVGGLVGWNNSGKVKGCYSLAKLEVSCSGQVGGLIGANSNGTVLACYVAGSISGTIYNNTGGFIAQNTINNADATVTACYSTTQINVTNNVGSNKLGAFVASNSTGINQCYFVGETVTNPVGNGSVNGISKVTATQLKDKKRQMNLAIEAKDPEFGFSFKVNEDAGTNIYCPLILQGAVKEPGFGGSDFGDGGDI